MGIDYAQVLAIINASDDPVRAFIAFIDQEREVAAFNAVKKEEL